MRKLLIAGLLACTCLQPSFATPLTYDELVNGDLFAGPSGFAIPVLAFDVGTNTIKGTTGVTDFDSFAFSVPTGASLIAASVTSADVSGNVTGVVWTFRKGSNLTGSGTFLDQIVAPSPGSGVFAGTPLGADTYSMVPAGISQDPTVTVPQFASYTFSFVVRALDTPVPAPATFALLGAGLAVLGLARRRRSG